VGNDRSVCGLVVLTYEDKGQVRKKIKWLGRFISEIVSDGRPPEEQAKLKDIIDDCERMIKGQLKTGLNT
jgi:hypothetical protein